MTRVLWSVPLKGKNSRKEKTQMKKGIKRTICILLTAISCISLAGCGEVAVGQADINPQTPIEEVTFPLPETKELSFITNAPARTEHNTLVKVFLEKWIHHKKWNTGYYNR